MGTFRGRGAVVDTFAMSQEMRKATRLWQTAYIIILNPGRNGALVKAGDNDAFVWSGPARVQPYRKDVKTPQVTDPVHLQIVRFQVDFSGYGDIPDIRSDYHIWVPPTSLSGVEYPDPYISEYIHVVDSAMNSSLAWLRTIETTVNTQIRQDYDIESDGAGGFRWIES